ncbi:MAG: TetR/AcrR family transcriptional regulator [Verrucomicrobiota bacterium]
MPRPSAREKLLEAGLKCFHAQGYNGTSIEDIADAAGVFKGSFYNHFRSKEALVVAVIERYEHAATANIARQGPPLGAQAADQPFRVAGLALRGGRLPQRLPDEQFQRGGLRRGQAAAARRGRGLRPLVRRIAELIRQAQKEGDIDRKDDPALLARFLGNSWEGATNYSKVVRNRKPLDDFFAMALPVVARR